MPGRMATASSRVDRRARYRHRRTHLNPLRYQADHRPAVERVVQAVRRRDAKITVVEALKRKEAEARVGSPTYVRKGSFAGGGSGSSGGGGGLAAMGFGGGGNGQWESPFALNPQALEKVEEKIKRVETQVSMGWLGRIPVERVPQCAAVRRADQA